LSGSTTGLHSLVRALSRSRHRPYNALALRGGNDFQKEAAAAAAAAGLWQGMLPPPPPPAPGRRGDGRRNGMEGECVGRSLVRSVGQASSFNTLFMAG